MSDNFVINPHLPTLNYLSHFPFRSIPKAIRSSSFRVTNISSSPKSASLIPIPKYGISFFSPIRSSKNLTIFYSKLLRPEGGIADKYPKGTEYSKSSRCAKGKPDLNGFLNQKQSASTVGRVEPQLNGFEGGIADKYPKRTEYSKSSKYAMGKPDLNYFFPSKCDLTPESGIKSKGAFDLDLFSQTRWSSGSKMPSEFLGAKMPSVLLGTVDAQRTFEFDSFRSCAAVTLRFKASEPQASIANFGDISRRSKQSTGQNHIAVLGKKKPLPNCG